MVQQLVRSFGTDRQTNILLLYYYDKAVFSLMFQSQTVLPGIKSNQKNLEYHTCHSKPYIQHFAGEDEFAKAFPVLFK